MTASASASATATATATLAAWSARLPGWVRRLLPLEPPATLRRRLGRRYPWEEGFEIEPPPSGGLPTGPPDFVGVGASLCGVRWWSGLLAAHPQLAGGNSPPTGLHYFSHFCLRDFTAEDAERYHRWFPRPPGSLAGEWTPAYAAQPWVAPLLARAAPQARLLFLVRDPVERFRLGLARLAGSRMGNVGAAVADVADRGFYAQQLRRLREFFPGDRILVLQLERCRDDPGGQLAATEGFLGLTEFARPPAVVPGDPDARPLERTVRERLSAMYREDAQDLAGMVPDLDLDRWPGVAAPPSRRRDPAD